MGYSPSLVAHVETGSRAPSLDFARRCDEALGSGGLLARLQPLARSAAYPAWFRDWVEIEREATALRWFEPLLIPGLLQTEEYARAVLAAAHPASPEAEVERLVSARMDRQAILDAAEPLLLWVILDEGVVTRPVGGPAVMRAQLDRLIEAARQAEDRAAGGAVRHRGASWARGTVRHRQLRRGAGRGLPGQRAGRAGRGGSRGAGPGRVPVRHTESRGAVPGRLDPIGEEGDRTMDLTGAAWRKSSYSSGNGGACVEVKIVPGSKEGSDYVITMRDSKDPDGPTLYFTPAEWEAFTLGVQDGEFDVPEDEPATLTGRLSRHPGSGLDARM